jgi:Flp pilus assembly protein TadG
MFRVAWPALSRLKADERGAALLLFTIVLVPMLAVVAVAIDLSRVLLIKQKLTNAADAAALAVGARAGLTSDEATAMAQSFIRAHYPDAEFGDLQNFNVVPGAAQVDVTVTARIPTTFLQVLNVSTLDITVHSQVARAQRKLEIALVLDRTGSMGGQKIVDLKAAAKDLVDIVVWDDQSASYYSKVALVPYAAGVNAGIYAAQVRGSISLGTCLQNIPGCLLFLFTNALGGLTLHQVSNCVSERTGAQAYTDAAPSVAFLGRNYPSTNNPCPSDTIVPLTDDKGLLKGRIDLLQASGTTAGHIGAAWGWYMLSPNFGYLWPAASRPAPYSELADLDAWGRPILQKIVVLMTDGEFNTAYCNGVVSKDSTASGASERINCNAPNGTSISQSQSVCGNMKAAGITVYTVGFALKQQSAINLMTQCATDATHAYLASNGAELRQAFRDIATKIVSLRLTH